MGVHNLIELAIGTAEDAGGDPFAAEYTVCLGAGVTLRGRIKREGDGAYSMTHTTGGGAKRTAFFASCGVLYAQAEVASKNENGAGRS